MLFRSKSVYNESAFLSSQQVDMDHFCSVVICSPLEVTVPFCDS